MATNNETPQQQPVQSEIDFNEVLGMCLSHWKWFILSVAVFMVFAVLYLLRTQPTYSSSASVLMADNSSTSGSMDFGVDMSMFQGAKKKNNVYNDLEVFKSPSLMQHVVKRLDLQMSYTQDGMFRDKICYGSSLPAKVHFLELDDGETMTFKMVVKKDSTFVLKDFVYQGLELAIDSIPGHFGDTIPSALGTFIVEPTPFYNMARKKVFDFVKDPEEAPKTAVVSEAPKSQETVKAKPKAKQGGNASKTKQGKNAPKTEEVKEQPKAAEAAQAAKTSAPSGIYGVYNVTRSDLYAVTASYAGRLSVNLSDERSTTINLGFTDSSAERAKEVLDVLINEYNGQWLQSKNQITSSTSVFISERLGLIEGELGNVDHDISQFKSANMMPNLEQVSSMAVQKSEALSTQISELNNELYIARYIKSYLTNEQRKNELLSVNSGFQNAAVATQIGLYNEKLLRRNALVSKSSEKNPLVQSYDKELYEMRMSIINAVDQEIFALNTKIRDLRITGQATTNTIKSSPTQAQYLLSVERQQKIKEALYLYLLQKREENELSQAFTAYNTQIVAAPKQASRIAPIPARIGMIAVMLGLVLPISIILFSVFSNTAIRGKDDLSGLSVPIIGEIPLYAKRKNDLRPSIRKKVKKIINKKEPDEDQKLLVAHGNRDVLNEAIRVVRTNLEFMSSGMQQTTILFTSFNAGSGKSFVSMNLAAALAIRGQRTLVVDCDLRHSTSSKYVSNPSMGISDYLAGRADDYRSLIVTHPDFPKLDVLPVGSVPPNPTELLSSMTFEQLMLSLKSNDEYKYIFLDCPPLDIVADTQIISKFADRTMFIARVGMLDRIMLPELQSMYEQERFSNMSIILNAVVAAGRYGYRYGYGAGYGYSYGYGGKSSKSYYYGSK